MQRYGLFVNYKERKERKFRKGRGGGNKELRSSGVKKLSQMFFCTPRYRLNSLTS
jgi:hypothetical protein